MRILKKGMVGDDVKILQQLLEVSVDGSFGAQTEFAVKKWQKENGLVVDGIVGPKTWTRMSELKTVSSDVIYNPLLVHITKLKGREIKYISIHYTAGVKSTKDSANAVKSVFEKREASADFCVDDFDIVQFNPDLKNYYCWAVGDAKHITLKGGTLYGKAKNKNTISIEICSNLERNTSASIPNHIGWYFTEESLNNAAKLVKILMNKFNIPIENVVRHYDISGKLCPGVIGWNNEKIYSTVGKATNKYNSSDEWYNFKQKLL